MEEGDLAITVTITGPINMLEDSYSDMGRVVNSTTSVCLEQ